MRHAPQRDASLAGELKLRLQESYQIESSFRRNESLPQKERARLRKEHRLMLADIYMKDSHDRVSKAVGAKSTMLDRLVGFWSNHFTVSTRGNDVQLMAGLFEEMAIRANVLGRFEDMLLAVEFHPAMMVYLNLTQSIGPNSQAGKRRSKGLNENLAREILELHTLGADGGYTQADVTEFAKIMTGWIVDYEAGDIRFAPRRAEPGYKTFLGKRYGGAGPVSSDYEQALRDLAAHPSTARHVARKMLLHFFGDVIPSSEEKLARVFLDSRGNLLKVYAALLELPEARSRPGSKARNDFEFVVSALRVAPVPAADVTPRVQNLRLRPHALSVGALSRMQQQMWRAESPKGWSERPEDWLGPLPLAERLDFISRLVPHIREARADVFLRNALGNLASQQTRHVVSLASSREEALALVLASPEFNRR